MTQSVLVTGAFGNIGCRTIHHLLKAGHRVVAVGRKTPKNKAIAEGFGDTVKVIWGNICDRDLWPRALSGIDTVVHIAGIIPPFSDRNPKLAVAVNQTATVELIRQMELSPTAKRLVFASSMILAGPEQDGRTPPLTANIEPRPTDTYGRTKAECEVHIRGSSLYWSILRIAACPPTHVTRKEMNSLVAMFHASADGRVEVVHPDDCGLALANAVSCDEAIGRILFIGGGEGCQTYALPFYNRMLSTVGLKPLSAELLRPGPAYFFGDWLDTTESQKLLAFQKHDLDAILAELKANTGCKRWLLKLVSPLVSAALSRRSPHVART